MLVLAPLAKLAAFVHVTVPPVSLVAPAPVSLT